MRVCRVSPIRFNKSSEIFVKIAAIALLAIGMSSVSVPSFAVDNSISALCRADQAGGGYQRPGGFCDAVKAYGSQGLSGSGRCPSQTHWDGTACVPEY